jgi:Tol biopolymer transport system component/DNA-binding winged helix-turn-helix (wHTH) protein
MTRGFDPKMLAPTPTARLTFGLFEADLHSGELWKAGFRIKLQSQPFKVLAVLLEHPGQVVTRDELQERLWGKDTVVDFDHSLGTAINKIREALGDSAENPRFIETLSKRGYRFIAPVGEVVIERVVETHRIEAADHPSPEDHHPTQPLPTFVALPSNAVPIQATLPVKPSQRLPLAWPLISLALCGAAVAAYFTGASRSRTVPPHIAQITHNGHIAPSASGMENLAAAATDGVHLFAATIASGHTMISAISLTGGAVVPLNIPDEVASPALGDISPDGSRLLLRDHLSPESEQPLWVVPTIGGSALRVGNVLAHDATWMPTGPTGDNAILFANGNQLFLTHLNGNDPKPYATLPGRAFWLRWEPNGRLLRFTVSDPLAHTLSLWQLSPSNRKPQPVLANFTQPANECCGVWTPDGHNFVFQSNHGGNSDLWRLSGESITDPVRLTDGPLQFQSPVAARSNSPGVSRIFFLGEDARSELEVVSASGELKPFKGFLSTAIRIDYSRDGHWVAWTDNNGQLWRARSDGSDRLQLSPDGQDVFLAHWSPDGSRLAVMAREPGKAWQIYLTGANGGGFQPLLKEARNAADPSWSPDGKALVFGRVNDEMGKENAARTLQILHLDTGAIEPVPASDGLFSPRWSPDGQYIAALSLDQQQVRLYTVATRTWTRLNVPSGADPIWTSDSRNLYVHASLDPDQPIERISIPDGHVDTVARLADARGNDAVDYVFGGLTQDNHPIIRARVFTGNVYSLDLK